MEDEAEAQENVELQQPQQKGRLLRCPKCGSEDVQFATSTSTTGISASDACCGYMLLGPLGLLCGLCGAGESTTKEFWVCHNCGAKFKADEVRAAQKKRLRDKAAYEAPLRDAPKDIEGQHREVERETESMADDAKAAPKKRLHDKALLQDASEDLEEQQRKVEQELSNISRLYDEKNKQLKTDYPQYRYICNCLYVGILGIIIGILLALVFAIANLSSGITFGWVVALVGLVVVIVASHQEDKVFDTIASPELKSLKEEKISLESQKKTITTQIEAETKKEK